MVKMGSEKEKKGKRKVFEILCKIYVYLELATDLRLPVAGVARVSDFRRCFYIVLSFALNVLL